MVGGEGWGKTIQYIYTEYVYVCIICLPADLTFVNSIHDILCQKGDGRQLVG